jgi:hypothetical protein
VIDMPPPSAIRSVAENLWTMEFPLNLLCGHQNRVVTLIRLSSGELIIHSTGPLTRSTVAEINALGTPAWMTDVMLRHDTFAKDGRTAFLNIPYLAPEGFGSTRPRARDVIKQDEKQQEAEPSEAGE